MPTYEYKCPKGHVFEKFYQTISNKRKIACPLLGLWGNKGGRWSDRDMLGVWREWASDVQGGPIASGHFLAEEAPDETYAALRQFLLA